MQEEEMAAHSNILGWKIPWVEEPEWETKHKHTLYAAHILCVC